MLQKTKKLFLVFAFVLLALVLVACGKKTKVSEQQLEVRVEETITLDGKSAKILQGAECVVLDGVTLKGEATGTALVEVQKGGSKVIYLIQVDPAVPSGLEATVITPETAISENHYPFVIGESEARIEAVLLPFGAEAEVTFISTKPEILQVRPDGTIEGKAVGQAAVTVLVEGNQELAQQFTFNVYSDRNKYKMLAEAKEEFLAQLPLFVTEDYQLPRISNPLVKMSFKKASGEPVSNGLFKVIFNTTEHDEKERVTAQFTIDNATLAFDFEMNQAREAEYNAFSVGKMIEENLATYALRFEAGLIDKDVALPTSLNELLIANGKKPLPREFYFTWEFFERIPGLVLNHTEFKPTPEEEKEGKVAHWTSATLAYTKPNDNVAGKIEAHYSINGIVALTRMPLGVRGYTPVEIVKYIKENTIGELPKELQGKNLDLPLYNPKFAAVISWESSQPAVVGNNGRINPDLAEEAEYALTAHIKYSGTYGKEFAFEDEIVFKGLKAIPLANEAQKLGLKLQNAIMDSEHFPKHFPYGEIGREGGNLFPVAKYPTVGSFMPESEHKDVAITWKATEEGLFDENFRLTKQFLRYHRTEFEVSFTLDGNEVTVKIPVNTGIAAVPAQYLGGRFASRKDKASPWDELHTFSLHDKGVGDFFGYEVLDSDGTWHTAFTGWDGQTYYVDFVDENGVTQRRQYFTNDPYTFVIEELEEKIVLKADEDTRQIFYRWDYEADTAWKKVVTYQDVIDKIDDPLYFPGMNQDVAFALKGADIKTIHFKVEEGRLHAQIDAGAWVDLVSEGRFAAAFINVHQGIGIDEKGMYGEVYSNSNLRHPNYQYINVYNRTEHAFFVPVTYLKYSGSTITGDINENGMARQVGITFDAWRGGFATLADGTVYWGSPENFESDMGKPETQAMFPKKLVQKFNENDPVVDADGNPVWEKDAEGNFMIQTLYPEQIEIPAGGHLYCPHTSQNKPDSFAPFTNGYGFVVGDDLVLRPADAVEPVAPKAPQVANPEAPTEYEQGLLALYALEQARYEALKAAYDKAVAPEGKAGASKITYEQYNVEILNVKNKPGAADPAETLVVGKETQIHAAAYAWEYRTNVGTHAVTYESLNDHATVNEEGVVTGVSAGEAVIIARSVADPTKTREYKIKVIDEIPTALEIVAADGNNEVAYGTPEQFTITTTPAAANKEVVWSVDKAELATISEDGILTVKDFGTVVITAKAVYDAEVTATFEVNCVRPALETVEIVIADEIIAGEEVVPTVKEVPEKAELPTDGVFTLKAGDGTGLNLTAHGVVQALKAEDHGVLVYTYTDAAGEAKTVEKKVTVKALAPEAPFDGIAIVKGDTLNLAPFASFAPLGASYELVWASSAAEVVEVDQNGVITAKALGEATITVNVKDNAELKKEFNVKVVAPAPEVPESVTIQGAAKVQNGATVQYAAKGKTTANPEFDTAVFWSVDNAELADITADGKVTVKGETGTFKVIAISKLNPDAKFELEVAIVKVPTALAISGDATIAIGETKAYTVTPTPADADATVTWSVNDTTLATIDAAGNLTAAAAGTVTITATSVLDGNVTATFEVTIA